MRKVKNFEKKLSQKKIVTSKLKKGRKMEIYNRNMLIKSEHIKEINKQLIQLGSKDIKNLNY